MQPPDTSTSTTLESAASAFDLDKLMEAITALKSLPPLRFVMCNPESLFAKMGLKFRESPLMPAHTAFVMQEGKVVQIWKLENGVVKVYEFKEPLVGKQARHAIEAALTRHEGA